MFSLLRHLPSSSRASSLLSRRPPSLTSWRASSTTSSASNLSEGEQHIEAKLLDRFSPTQLQVQDVSGGCGTFYAITIASSAFNGLSTVKQHKLVTEVLKQEIEGIHGLQIKTIPSQSPSS